MCVCKCEHVCACVGGMLRGLPAVEGGVWHAFAALCVPAVQDADAEDSEGDMDGVDGDSGPDSGSESGAVAQAALRRDPIPGRARLPSVRFSSGGDGLASPTSVGGSARATRWGGDSLLAPSRVLGPQVRGSAAQAPRLLQGWLEGGWGGGRGAR
jgi:hypothetical protein